MIWALVIHFIFVVPLYVSALQRAAGMTPWLEQRFCVTTCMALDAACYGDMDLWLMRCRGRYEWTPRRECATSFPWWRLDVWLWALDCRGNDGRLAWRVWA